MSEQMTPQEAIDKLNEILKMNAVGTFLTEKSRKAVCIAIAAIQSAIPRVLLAVEVAFMGTHTAVWAEFRSEGIVTGPHERGTDYLSEDWFASAYNHTVRWWNAWPSPELRKATPWKEDC